MKAKKTGEEEALAPDLKVNPEKKEAQIAWAFQALWERRKRGIFLRLNCRST